MRSRWYRFFVVVDALWLFQPYFYSSLFFLSLSSLKLDFCSPLSVNLQDELFSLFVHDLYVTSLIYHGHGQLYCDLSLSFLESNVAVFEFLCLVEEGGEEGACLIRREVTIVFQIKPLDGVYEAGLI